MLLSIMIVITSFSIMNDERRIDGLSFRWSLAESLCQATEGVFEEVEPSRLQYALSPLTVILCACQLA